MSNDNSTKETDYPPLFGPCEKLEVGGLELLSTTPLHAELFTDEADTEAGNSDQYQRVFARHLERWAELDYLDTFGTVAALEKVGGFAAQLATVWEAVAELHVERNTVGGKVPPKLDRITPAPHPWSYFDALKAGFIVALAGYGSQISSERIQAEYKAESSANTADQEGERKPSPLLNEALNTTPFYIAAPHWMPLPLRQRLMKTLRENKPTFRWTENTAQLLVLARCLIGSGLVVGGDATELARVLVDVLNFKDHTAITSGAIGAASQAANPKVLERLLEGYTMNLNTAKSMYNNGLDAVVFTKSVRKA
ncbi:MAG: hypothetical protein AB8F78_17390 [Saprospiraceae bacterium]